MGGTPPPSPLRRAVQPGCGVNRRFPMQISLLTPSKQRLMRPLLYSINTQSLAAEKYTRARTHTQRAGCQSRANYKGTRIRLTKRRWDTEGRGEEVGRNGEWRRGGNVIETVKKTKRKERGSKIQTQTLTSWSEER